MSDKPRHSIAYFKDQFGMNIPIFASDLEKDETFLLARRKELFDVNEQYRLFVRNHHLTRHFYTRNPIRKLISTRNEKDPIHDKSIRTIKAYLEKDLKAQLGFMNFDEAEDGNFEELVKLENYRWGTEIEYPISQFLKTRFDIFGQRNDLVWSGKQPHIGIEIVHTHFQERDVFQYLLLLTRQLPLVIFYFFTKGAPKINRMAKSPRSQIHRIFFSYYMLNGKVWYLNNDTNTKIQQYDGLRLELEKQTLL